MSDENPYRVPPTTGPTPTLAKVAAHVEMHSVWLWRLVLLATLAWWSVGVRGCTLRWSEEDESQCTEACRLSGDIAYDAGGSKPCRCLAPNGSRYNPYASREVCGGD